MSSDLITSTIFGIIIYLYSKNLISGYLSGSIKIPARQTGNSSSLVNKVNAFIGSQLPSSGPDPVTLTISPGRVYGQ